MLVEESVENNKKNYCLVPGGYTPNINVKDSQGEFFLTRKNFTVFIMPSKYIPTDDEFSLGDIELKEERNVST